MGGGLMQLVAYGAQDIYLTGNPQITFFKVVYRRHTNFSMECIQQTINGATALIATTTSTGTVTISRNGDLVGKVYVRCDQDTTALTGINGDKLISEVVCEIGGQQIDKQYEEWLQIWAELSTPESKASGYKYLTGGYTNNLVSGGGTSQQSIMVPLQFWFCRNPGLALPLIALQYHEVKLKFTWGTGDNVSRSTTDVTTMVEVWADYIYLDTDERRRFAQVSHEYLIEQLQKQGEGSADTSYKLNFNHPVKELIWTDDDGVTTQKTKLQLNGHDRFAEQDREYFQIRQPLDCHTAVPGYNIKETERPQPIAPTDGGILLQSATETVSTTVTLSATQLLWAAGGTTIDNFKIGDVVVLNYGGGDNAAANDTFTHICQITVITSDTTLTFSPSWGVAFPTLTDGDALTAIIVARVQDPKSRCSQLAQNVNVYSFALKPEEHQPSGTCNFSRIDNAKLVLSASGTIENIYAVNYNVLRIMSGMGGLAYSN
jgi:hypothetical protein